MSLVRALSHPPFALLWIGQTASRLGDSLYQLALVWWVLEYTGSATALSTLFICAFIPKIVFVLIGGVVVDRLPRLHIMLLADLLCGVLIGALVLLTALHSLVLWHLYLAATIFGCIEAFFMPAYTAILPDITPGDLLPSANMLTSLSNEIAGVTGPALGALVIASGGATLAFAIDGLSFAISGACLLPLLKLPISRISRAKRTSINADIRVGLHAVRATPWLWITIVILALLNLTGRSPIQVGLPFLVRDQLHIGVDSLGWLYATFSLGAMAGAVGIGVGRRIRQRGKIVYVGLVIVGLITAALSIAQTLTEAVVALFALGVVLTATNLVWAHIVQEHVPADVRGRVASINLLGSTALLPLSFALTGWATDRLGSALVFLIGGLLTTGLASVGLKHHTIRELE